MSEVTISKAILVTGGSRGIGRAISLELASKGYDIIFTFNTDSIEAHKTAEEISRHGVKAEPLQVDLTSRSQIEVFTTKLLEKGTRLFALVNNAGIYQGTTLNETKDEEWEKVIGLNLSAPFYLSRNLNGIIVEGGSIVNISSVYGFRADPWAHGYQASKAALIHLTKGLAKELAPAVRVNAVAPGYVRTDMNRGGWESESFSSRIKKATPMKRWGEPEDIGRAVAFLINPENTFITGHTLVVDGGIGI